jgi:hypothetical protein
MPSSDQIIQQIRERIDYASVFGAFMELRGSGAERSAKCVFHEDSNPSMSVNVDEGVYLCHGCGASGDFISFWQRVRSCTFPEAIREIAQRVGIPLDADPSQGDSGVIDESIAESAHERLLATQPMLDWLAERRGITEATVREWKLGHDGQRFYIPIRDEVGRLVNIRRYQPDSTDASAKMISWRAGYGQARLWPFNAFDTATLGDGRVFLFEGEMDALLALTHGINAMTCTGGAGTWRDAWTGLFAGLDVVICYDNDSAGRLGSLTVAQKLVGRARSVKVVQIPLEEPRGADFTDYIHGHGQSAADFLAMVEATPEFAVTEEVAEEIDAQPIGDVHDVHLSRASLADFNQCRVRMPVMVSGKTMAPYIVPTRVLATCSMPGLKMCDRCPVAQAAGRLDCDLGYDQRTDVLECIDITTTQLNKTIKARIRIPPKCTYVTIEPIESLNIEEVQLIPDVAESDEESPYVTRAAYHVGHGLDANRTYVVSGVTTPMPRNQTATHLLHEVVPSQSNIDAFQLTPEVIAELRIFQPEGDTLDALDAKLDEIQSDLECVTNIYKRRDLMTSVDLVYHSILGFTFQGQRVRRGWTEALIIGDSRTGKTTVVEELSIYYRAGEFTTGENTSLAGLVGGLQQIGTTWALRWGKVPLNDRRLLTIDEAGNLPVEHIARMSAMRSSGRAEIVKVHTERTNARTRMIWISNPRASRPLSSYSRGITAIKELIGAPEDIARFDLFVTATSSDVPLSIVNAEREPHTPERYTSALCHQRVMWAWSRSASDVEIQPEAVRVILARATQQGQKYRYCTEVPLVEPNEQRIKLARLAVAAAAMFFSTDTQGQRVIVKPCHVEFAYYFLERLLSTDSLAFAEWAQEQTNRNELREHDAILRLLAANPNAVRLLMANDLFSGSDLKEILAITETDRFRQALTLLRGANFLTKAGALYKKSPAAIRWLRNQPEAPQLELQDTSDAPF